MPTSDLTQLDYSRENVQRALSKIIKTEGTLKLRLGEGALLLNLANPVCLPEGPREELLDLQGKLRGGTALSMSDSEAESYAGRIMALYADLWKITGQAAR